MKSYVPRKIIDSHRTENTSKDKKAISPTKADDIFECKGNKIHRNHDM